MAIEFGKSKLSEYWALVKSERIRIENKQKSIVSHLTVTGENEVETAMARTVGLPLAIATKLLLEGKINKRGVVIPIEKEIYDPVLAELTTLGIRLDEEAI